jgi:hypothetical protein
LLGIPPLSWAPSANSVEPTDRARAGNAGISWIFGQREQLVAGAGRAERPRLQSVREVLEATVQHTVPRLYLVCRPLRRLVGVAAVAELNPEYF